MSDDNSWLRTEARSPSASRALRASSACPRSASMRPMTPASTPHALCGSRELLPGQKTAAYLDQEALIAIARETGATAVHPGYGFLSENAGFAARCAKAGLTFIGPSSRILDLFSNKIKRTRRQGREHRRAGRSGHRQADQS